MRIRRKFLTRGRKCGGCNWECETVYSFPTNDINKEGLCAHCFMDMLVDGRFEVSAGEENVEPLARLAKQAVKQGAGRC